MSAAEILEALKGLAYDKIWASELAFFGTARRIDFWTLEPTRSQGFRTSAYEIKVSRADFKRDSAEKQAGAIKFSDRFWYVTPTGLLTRADLPEWAGLQEWDGQRFSIIRRAPKLARSEPDWEFIVSLMRNCGDSRRDVGLMRAQVAYLEQRVGSLERAQRSHSEHHFRKFMLSAPPRALASQPHTEDGASDA